MFADIIDVLVNLVGNDNHAFMSCEDASQTGQLFFGIYRTRRIAGRAENQRTCFRRDGRFQLFGCNLEILFYARFYNDRFSFGQFDHLGIADPIRSRNDHLIAGIDQCHDGITYRLFGAVGAKNLCRCIVQAVFVFQLGRDGFAQCGIARYGRIA